MKVFAVLTAWALWVLPLLSLAEGVRYRGIFVNDEDWGLRPWAVRHFAAQCAMLPEGAPKLFCPYKEVLPIFNAGLKVPEDATILWVNDNFGYVRRIGGDHGIHGTHGRQGIYWHLSYWGSPHGYIHLCTTPPAFMWYELVAKCWENGVRDVWMVNAGDVFQAEILLDAFGKFAADPESWGPDAQVRFLSSWATTFLSSRVGKSDVGCPKSDVLAKRIAAHLAEYYNLGFNRKPEHMCVQWSRNLPESVKASLLKRYHDLLNEDMAIERLLHDSTRSTRLKIADEYFRLVGFQARFLAYAGIIHLEGRDKAYARAVLDPLYARWDALDGGKWSGFWIDTIEEKPGKHQPTAHNRWSSQMQWPWNEPDDQARKDRRGESRNDYVATAYAWERAKGLEEPTWLEPVARESGAKGGEWVNVAGLGTSGNALALLPVKPGVGDGALLKFDLNHLPTHSSTHPLNQSSLVLQFLPDFALWPGLKLGVKVSFDDGEAKYVEVPRSDSNIGEKDSVRAVAVQDNFIRVDVPIPSGAKTATITAVDPGVVIDRVGVRPTRQASGSGERIISQGANDPTPGKGMRAIASLFNPLDEPIRRRVVLPLYYAGLSDKAEISVGDDAAFVPVALDARCRAEVEVSIPANGNSSR